MSGVRRIGTAEAPEAEARRVARLLETVRRVATSEHELRPRAGDQDPPLEFGRARVVLVVWMDDSGHGAWAQTHLRPGWADVAGQPEKDNAAAFAELVHASQRPSFSFGGPPRSPIREANERHDRHLARRAEDAAALAAEKPWSCEYCTARFGSRRGAEQHEAVCLGGREGRNGHRCSAGEMMPPSPDGHRWWRQRCVCGGIVVSRYQDRKRAFVRHADEVQASLLELPPPPAPPTLGVV